MSTCEVGFQFFNFFFQKFLAASQQSSELFNHLQSPFQPKQPGMCSLGAFSQNHVFKELPFYRAVRFVQIYNEASGQSGAKKAHKHKNIDGNYLFFYAIINIKEIARYLLFWVINFFDNF